MDKILHCKLLTCHSKELVSIIYPKKSLILFLIASYLICFNDLMAQKKWNLEFFFGPNLTNVLQMVNREKFFYATPERSFYTKAGCGFWTELMLAELNGIVFHNINPYHQVDGIVNIAKAWAYHVGWFFADKNYQDPQRSIEWCDFLEFFRNRESGHMPCGVFHDLKDLVQNGIEYTSDLCCGGNYPVSDNVQGYNSNQMFSLLGGNTKSPNSFYQQFKTNYGNSDPVLLQKMDDLFNSY